MSKTDFGKSLQGMQEVDLEVIGRKTGKRISLPVWFTLDENTLRLLPLKGTATNWYKNLARNPTLTLKSKGAKVSFKAKLSTEKREVETTIEKFRSKYGAADVKRYYSKFDACVLLRPT